MWQSGISAQPMSDNFFVKPDVATRDDGRGYVQSVMGTLQVRPPRLIADIDILDELYERILGVIKDTFVSLSNIVNDRDPLG